MADVMSEWSVIFWDVGQGDATDITLPNGEHIVIDAGPHSKVGNPLTWWYVQHGHPVISLGILTHSHIDHFGGFMTLASDLAQTINNFVFLSDCEVRKSRAERNENLNRLMDVLRIRASSSRTKCRLLEQAGVLYEGNGLRLRMAYPRDLSPDVKLPSDVNRSSMVILLERIEGGDPLIVWGGDNTLNNIASACEGISPFIMMGPHHGHPQGATQIYWKFFRDKLTPKYAYVSVGRVNSHKLPDKNYIKGAACAGVRVCCSQLAINCDPNRLFDVYPGSGELGLSKPLDSIQCRGAMRVFVSAESGVRFDNNQKEFEKYIAAILPDAPCKCSSLGNRTTI